MAPELPSDCADSTEQPWITDIYGFVLAGLLITMGTLGDRVGRRKPLFIGGGAFAVASVVATYSNSPEMMIVARALLGIAGATLASSTMALIRNVPAMVLLLVFGPMLLPEHRDPNACSSASSSV